MYANENYVWFLPKTSPYFAVPLSNQWTPWDIKNLEPLG